MYEGCFGLNRRPFAAVPQVDDYYPAAAIEGARTTLVRCIERGEGAALVIGPSGTGKTLLSLLIARHFNRLCQVVTLASGRLSTRRALFQAILYALGRPYRGMDEGEARLAVIDYLMTGDSRPMVLLVDEAHTLPLRLLEEIRLLTNLVSKGQPMVRLVLFGNPTLEERFASPKLDSFSQRLIARCYLESVNRTETQEYVRHQIDATGGRGESVFSDKACENIAQVSGGVPRLINQVCDHAMLLAYVAGRDTVEATDIQEAWSDLQQLPTPWAGEAQESSAGVIEFGSLDDLGETGPSPAPEQSLTSSALHVTGEESDTEAAGPSQQIHRIERLLAEADDEFQPAGTIGPELDLHFEDVPEPFLEVFEHEEVVADRYQTPSVSFALPTVAAPVEPQPVAASEEAATLDEGDYCKPDELEYAAARVSATSGQVKDLSQDDRKPTPPSPTFPPANTPTLRREYKQLFARLRRG